MFALGRRYGLHQIAQGAGGRIFRQNFAQPFEGWVEKPLSGHRPRFGTGGRDRLGLYLRSKFVRRKRCQVPQLARFGELRPSLLQSSDGFGETSNFQQRPGVVYRRLQALLAGMVFTLLSRSRQQLARGGGFRIILRQDLKALQRLLETFHHHQTPGVVQPLVQLARAITGADGLLDSGAQGFCPRILGISGNPLHHQTVRRRKVAPFQKILRVFKQPPRRFRPVPGSLSFRKQRLEFRIGFVQLKSRLNFLNRGFILPGFQMPAAFVGKRDNSRMDFLFTNLPQQRFAEVPGGTVRGIGVQGPPYNRLRRLQIL